MKTMQAETSTQKTTMPPDSTAQGEASSPRGLRLAVAAVLLLFVLVGGYLRFANLDALTIQVDEGFQALAVEAVLTHGYPKLESGFVYGRSPLFLYAQALSAKLFGLSEWSLRAPAAVFSLLAIPVAYVLGSRLMLGVRWRTGDEGSNTLFAALAGLLLAGMMALSAWEVEYARYGRFYSLFQLLYMLGVLAFMQGYLRNGRGYRSWRVAYWVLFMLTVSVHDLGVMLGLCFWAVLPLRGYATRTKAIYFAQSAVCGVLWVGYNKVWRGLQESLATAWPDVKADGTAELSFGGGAAGALLAKVLGLFPPVNLPVVRYLEQAWSETPWVLALAALPAAAATGYLVWLKLRALSAPRRGEDLADDTPCSGRLWLPVLLAAVWTAAFQQFMLAVVALLVFAAWRVRSWRHWLSPPVLVTLACVGASMAVWVFYFWQHDTISKHQWVPAVLDTPAVHHYFLQWFVPGWKRMMVLMLPAVYVVARLAARGTERGGRANGAWLLLIAIAAPILVTSELQWQFSESRYFFHLYPLMLLLLAAAGVWGAAIVRERVKAGPAWLVPSAVAGVGLLGLMIVTQDLNPAKAYAVTTRQHGDTKDTVRSVINFKFYAGWSQDQKTASLAAKDQIGENDTVLVVGPVHIAANYRYYLGRVDYVASTEGQYNQAKLTEEGRRVDLVSGGEVVSSAVRLREIAMEVERSGGVLWVFSDTEMVSAANWYLSDAEPALKEAVAALSTGPVFVGKDGKTTATRVSAPVARLSALSASELAVAATGDRGRGD